MPLPLKACRFFSVVRTKPRDGDPSSCADLKDPRATTKTADNGIASLDNAHLLSRPRGRAGCSRRKRTAFFFSVVCIACVRARPSGLSDRCACGNSRARRVSCAAVAAAGVFIFTRPVTAPRLRPKLRGDVRSGPLVHDAYMTRKRTQRPPAPRSKGDSSSGHRVNVTDARVTQNEVNTTPFFVQKRRPSKDFSFTARRHEQRLFRKSNRTFSFVFVSCSAKKAQLLVKMRHVYSAICRYEIIGKMTCNKG